MEEYDRTSVIRDGSVLMRAKISISTHTSPPAGIGLIFPAHNFVSGQRNTAEKWGKKGKMVVRESLQ